MHRYGGFRGGYGGYYRGLTTGALLGALVIPPLIAAYRYPYFPYYPYYLYPYLANNDPEGVEGELKEVKKSEKRRQRRGLKEVEQLHNLEGEAITGEQESFKEQSELTRAQEETAMARQLLGEEIVTPHTEKLLPKKEIKEKLHPIAEEKAKSFPAVSLKRKVESEVYPSVEPHHLKQQDLVIIRRVYGIPSETPRGETIDTLIEQGRRLLAENP